MNKRIPDDANVRLIDLPPGIGGAIMEDEDGFTTIFVNARHSHDARIKDLEHEISHVVNDDLHSEEPISTIEARADGLPAPLKPIPNLMRARDLIPPSPSLPDQKKEAQSPPLTEEVPRSPVPISPHQAAVLLHAINDLDDWLFRDTTYDL